MINKNFFFNFDLESSEVDETEVQMVFENEVFKLSKDDSNIIEKLKKEMEKVNSINK